LNDEQNKIRLTLVASNTSPAAKILDSKYAPSMTFVQKVKQQ
jgi:hypothetical protein